jgi:hypothetical protein
MPVGLPVLFWFPSRWRKQTLADAVGERLPTLSASAVSPIRIPDSRVYVCLVIGQVQVDAWDGQGQLVIVDSKPERH